MFIAPILLGDGVRLFEHPGGANVRLKPMPGESGALVQRDLLTRRLPRSLGLRCGEVLGLR